MIYFTADLHFGHNNIIKHTGRPFRDFEEMDRSLIKNWNQKVMPQDAVYILGDVTMKGPDFAQAAMTQLNSCFENVEAVIASRYKCKMAI